MAKVLNIGVLLLFSSMFVVSCCFSISEKVLMWKDHKIRTDNFLCEPRPRSFVASDIVKELHDADNIVPWETVLYRCDSQSGCCKNENLECAPAGEELVQLAFFSLITQEISIYEATNHTCCSCQDRSGVDQNSIKK